MVTDDFYKSTFWTKDDSQYSISIRIMSLLEAIEDVRTCPNAYAAWFSTYPVTVNLDNEWRILACSIFGVYDMSKQVNF
jgi:hypothetical protein